MTRAQAIAIIARDMGFRSELNTLIIVKLQEAQRELESGKTLPKFLLQEGATLTLAAGVNNLALPTRFIRESDDNTPYYIPTGTVTPVHLTRVNYKTAVDTWTGEDAAGPKVYVVRKSTIKFFPDADQAYTVYWDYYQGAETLDAEVENAWLANAPDWLNGEAGWRAAMTARDKDAIQIFDAMRKTARASLLADIIADEEASGPMVMGENN